MNPKELKAFLDRKVAEYNGPFFVAGDPVSIPHLFHRRQDIEIAAFFSAIFAWGNRRAIIASARRLMELMSMQPYEFIMSHSAGELRALVDFRHRTFNATDLLYFIEFFRSHYERYDSLERAFTMHGSTVEEMLCGFHRYFFSPGHAPLRTRKHIATPEKNSTCKRLNMFLRWMVRRDDCGVDFGLWENISPAQLICPIDLHVARVARQFGLLQRRQTDWRAALELTGYLRTLDSADPVKYDFALFGLGVGEKFG